MEAVPLATLVLSAVAAGAELCANASIGASSRADAGDAIDATIPAMAKAIKDTGAVRVLPLFIGISLWLAGAGWAQRAIAGAVAMLPSPPGAGRLD